MESIEITESSQIYRYDLTHKQKRRIRKVIRETIGHMQNYAQHEEKFIKAINPDLKSFGAGEIDSNVIDWWVNEYLPELFNEQQIEIYKPEWAHIGHLYQPEWAYPEMKFKLVKFDSDGDHGHFDNPKNSRLKQGKKLLKIRYDEIIRE